MGQKILTLMYNEQMFAKLKSIAIKQQRKYYIDSRPLQNKIVKA